MKKGFVSLVIICCIILCVMPAIAEDVVSTITSSAKATMDVEPDLVSFYAAIITEETNTKIALKENNRKSEKVYEALKKLLGENDKIKTSSLKINPIYKWDKFTKENELKGYRVSNQVIVKTKQLDKIGEFLQVAIDSGASSINNLVFSMENEDGYCDELIQQAAIKAKNKAQLLAKSLNVKIVGIKNVTSHCDHITARPVIYGGAMSTEKDAPIPIEPGEINLNASATIEFIIQNQ